MKSALPSGVMAQHQYRGRYVIMKHAANLIKHTMAAIGCYHWTRTWRCTTL